MLRMTAAQKVSIVVVNQDETNLLSVNWLKEAYALFKQVMHILRERSLKCHV